jgi:oligopeptide transport system permease protein
MGGSKNESCRLKSKLAQLSLAFIVFITLLAIFAPHITPYSFFEQHIADRLQSPSHQHWMGTDALGRDLFSRILYGARMSLAVGFFATLVGLVVGTSVGAVSGFFGGWIDSLLMRMVDVFYIFPSMLIAILLMLILGRGFVGIYLAIGMTAWVTQARLVRALVLQNKELGYVEAARAVGLNGFDIVTRHILPNLWAPMIVSLTIQIPAAVMAESFLSFLGLGLQPPFSSWGTLASEGFHAMHSYPHLIIFPGAILFLTMMAFSYLGDGLSEITE